MRMTRCKDGSWMIMKRGVVFTANELIDVIALAWNVAQSS